MQLRPWTMPGGILGFHPLVHVSYRWLTVSMATGLTLLAVGQLSLGPLSGHMSSHIVLMNLAAPMLALSLASAGVTASPRPVHLALATGIQIAVLWSWHMPDLLQWAHSDNASHLSMMLMLFASALWYWMSILAQPAQDRWRAVLSLLITGKLFCILGILLTFSPALLYPSVHAGHGVHGSFAGIADQQLAGLLMLAACPATYVLAGVVLAARWLGGLAHIHR